MSSFSPVWLVGSGGMAVDYAKVLKALDVSALVIGRGNASAQSFTDRTGLPVHAGGLEAFLAGEPELPRAAIVSVGVEALAPTTRLLLDYGVRRILVEKPGALHRHEIEALAAVAADRSAEVIIAYNRRMYAATLHAQRLIAEDGGVQSLHFEFTEWGHVIAGLQKADGVKAAWLLGNSTHVIDLAFYLGGAPIEMHCYTSGSLDWHPRSAVFAGAGRTDRGALFSYQANWSAPGRWGVEVLTANHRLVFRPMEDLQIIRKGSVAVESVSLDDQLDKAFKPGLYEQVDRFLRGRFEGLCTLDDQLAHWPIYTRIAGYDGAEWVS
jgi:predicted dehydrogenase